jgi:IS30 family transposase
MQATLFSVYKSSDRKNCKSKMNQNKKLYDYVVEKLNLYWSPEQIHMELKKEFPENKAMRIATETIHFYMYVHAKPALKSALIEQLGQKRKYRGNVRRGKDKRTTIADKTSIDERPRKVLDWRKPKEVFEEFVMKKIGTIQPSLPPH